MLFKYARLVFLSVCCAGLIACGDDDTFVEEASSSTADFTSYKTFAISSAGTGTATIPEDVNANLTTVNEAMRTQLVGLGLTEVDITADPDLVGFSLATTDDEAAVSWGCAPGYYYGYWAWTWQPCTWLTPIYSEYTVGTVVLGLSDPVAEQVVFGGVIQGVLNGDSTEEITNDINDGVEDIFDDYPAEQTGS
jgi:hypothetical protein